MDKLRILNKKQLKQIRQLLSDEFSSDFDIDSYAVFLNNKDKLYIVNGDISGADLSGLRLNSLGMYFATFLDNTLRLSIEGAQLVAPTASRNVIELTDEQAGYWMAGVDFEIESECSGYVIVTDGRDVLGCGKISGGKLYNYVPKERRIQ